MAMFTCSCMLCPENCIDFTWFINDHYIIQSYRSVYGMSFHPLPDELEWTNYTRPQVEAYSSRWKFGYGQWMLTRLHNEMDARESHAPYRCDICNNTSHNRKTCSNQ